MITEGRVTEGKSNRKNGSQKLERHSAWKVQYLVKLECQFSWQGQFLMKLELECHFLWQGLVNEETWNQTRQIRKEE